MLPKMVKMTGEIVKRATLPVTVKTRLGWDGEDSVNIMGSGAERLQVSISAFAALSIHGRTRCQMYKGSRGGNRSTM